MPQETPVTAGDSLPAVPVLCHDPLVPDRPLVPPSKAIADDLRRRIAAGEWEHGAQLPTNAQIAEQYGHARRTVSKAMKILEAEGLVVITPNWGTHRA